MECDGDLIVIDCGSTFPKEDMLGIDLVIPDISYLEANKERLRGFVFTHGHEDHIGATPYVLAKVPAPIYGSRMTMALIGLGTGAFSLLIGLIGLISVIAGVIGSVTFTAS